MNPGLQPGRALARRRRPPPAGTGPVVALDRARIERALGRRARYRYVQPRVEPEGSGWKVVSPNCSRNIDAAGGEIAIAWLVPAGEGRWSLHARDHANGCWVPRAAGLTLHEALGRLCADPLREFWQ